MSVKRLSFKGDTRKRKRVNLVPSEENIITKRLAKEQQANEENTWTTASSMEDLNGPLIITFMYDEGYPIALSLDPRGSLFTSALPTSLEPNDVRQVFVIATIPTGKATASEKRYSLKSGGCARYLGADRIGSLSCDSDAISDSHYWTLVQRPDGWALRSPYDLYLSIQPKQIRNEPSESSVDQNNTKGTGKGGYDIRCDSEDVGFCEAFLLRTQPQHRIAQTSATRHSANTTFTTRLELEKRVGRKLEDEELQSLRKAEKAGDLGEAILDMRVKGRSDKFG